jgi:DNA replication initiation complex subunit (GINS family)
MDLNEFNYKTLRKIQQIEEKNPTLSKIDSKLYTNFSEYIKNLNLRFKNETNEQRKIIIKNEINNTKKIIKNIYEQREKKILHAIITKVRGGNPNLESLIKAEKNLFESILKLVNIQRQKIIESEIIKNNSINHNKYNLKKIKNDNKIFLIKKNIPEFIGTDEKKYNLKKNDIIIIPKETSELLIKRKVVKEINKK